MHARIVTCNSFGLQARSVLHKSTKCEAQLSVTAGEMEFRVKVTQQITSHNHAMDNFPDSA
ncbi:hypothetical protein PF005_g20639 [Phytophthora fragariae]|uniref:Uncharacterized protein n=1 Tax=Phytophthora fragariae TaxID=53985 RepID=A0A6A3Z4G7_9STRA|nr:hypothetical protein PF005_g20639 [Phytophthora fragariae]KAE9229126.1 hypothetical protein PF002_g13396 [Phytophthora fragariae]